MKKQICTIILFLTCRICEAQNLVPNGDFEQYSSCPDGEAEIDSALFWFNPCLPPYGSAGTESGSSDYFNVCSTSSIVDVPSNYFGYQAAHSGNGYAGLIAFYGVVLFREYIEVPLISPLISNANYHFEMYVNFGDHCRYAVDTIGAYFSTSAISSLHSHDPLPFTPQIKNTSGIITDTLNWTLISGNFTAQGGESHVIIGNFYDDANTDTLTIHPGVVGFAYLFIDDVSLTLLTGIEEQNQNVGIKIYPNPAMDNFNVTVNSKELSEIILYDITSRKLLQREFTNSISLNTEQLAKGLYLYEVINKDGSCKKGKLVKD